MYYFVQRFSLPFLLRSSNDESSVDLKKKKEKREIGSRTALRSIYRGGQFHE